MATIMGPEAILKEVEILRGVSASLQALADEHPTISEGLLRIAENIDNAAVILAVLVAKIG